MQNIYRTPTEMYQALLDNGSVNVEYPNIIISENLDKILKNTWQKMLFNRFITFNLLDAVIDKSAQSSSDFYSNNIMIINDFKHIDPIQISTFDKIERMKKLLDFLSFDASNLRKQKSKEMQKIKQRVYVDGQIKIKYGYKNNNGKKLMIFFQGKRASLAEIHRQENKITHKTMNELFQHDKYQFFKYSLNNPNYDFVYLEDDFNYIHGWYMTNFGSMIVSNIQNFIVNLGNNYEEIHFVGTSKGGYGAYHVGKDMKQLTSLTLIAPILDIAHYIDILKVPTLKAELSNNDSALFKQIQQREQIKPDFPEKIMIVTGKSDYDYKKLLQLSHEYPEIIFEEVDENYTHLEIISNSYKRVLSKRLN
ncbi:hypothetical protein LI951_12675 [Enterococcus sp. BWT-B8]|uniref:hypothetical protein n=1 Tax=unclassified Enterococcus TaxID=2608891 RepID=UPI001E57FDC6|nr:MULTISPECIES: hypothetical protein [unclassified Enterococcus]MCB5952924.1 hypothetical protein [Enterococcus sp. BWT-B8]MCB5953568.1 hypothetical protein [Enterococcus sp. CWB-B31]